MRDQVVCYLDFTYFFCHSFLHTLASDSGLGGENISTPNLMLPLPPSFWSLRSPLAPRNHHLDFSLHLLYEVVDYRKMNKDCLNWGPWVDQLGPHYFCRIQSSGMIGTQSLSIVAGALPIQLIVPLVGSTKDFQLQVRAPWRAHQKKAPKVFGALSPTA